MIKSSLKPLWKLAFPVLLRIGIWANSLWSNSVAFINEFTRYPQNVSLPLKRRGRPLNGSWIAPLIDNFKFNIDAAIRGYVGLAGIGGIPRNHKGDILIRFLRSIGISDITGVELTVILEACQILVSCRWAENNNLIIESDCLHVVQWIENPSSFHPSYVELVAKCCVSWSSSLSMCVEFGSIRVGYGAFVGCTLHVVLCNLCFGLFGGVFYFVVLV
ncbi:hypothetical protein F3Y22_tig00000778pilonHSYRG00235 [Hibiscus syriacus]|uniref:RNase H type-1 domain-containing protein n=1 Tax=Hibiscus syriacus TaxID=106335 RepID=A0A6A3D459_HIBSY|nr:hypothetical protein F3Y22_tig00000778pilonHSYRG00235 [Hibiscus syriacus]